MSKGKLKKIEREWGKTIPDILIELYEEYGNEPNVQSVVAQKLAVTQGTISLWLARFNLVKTVTLTRGRVNELK